MDGPIGSVIFPMVARDQYVDDGGAEHERWTDHAAEAGLCWA
jgi:hypothetical protein